MTGITLVIPLVVLEGVKLPRKSLLTVYWGLVTIAYNLNVTEMSLMDFIIPAVRAASWAPTSTPDMNELVSRIIDLILLVVVIAAVIYIMFAGIQYVTSAGDAAKAKTAMASITNAIIGLIVAFSAYVLVKLIASKLGVTIQTTIPT